MSLQLFTELCYSIEAKISEKALVDLLVKLLDKLEDQDKLWLIALLSGKGPKRITTLSEMKEWAKEQSELPDWLFEECQTASGDLAETIALVIHSESTEKASLAEVIELVKEMRGSIIEFRKAKLIDFWDTINPAERLIFNKIATGTFRFKVALRIMAKAIGLHTGRAPEDVSVQLDRKWNPDDESFLTLCVEPIEGVESARPYLFEDLPLQLPRLELPEPMEEFVIQRVFEGVRAQIVIRNDTIWIWNDCGDILTRKCPEFHSAKSAFTEGLVIVGQIVGMSGGRFLPRDHVNKRLKKMSVTMKDMDLIPLHFIAEDILEIGGRELLNSSFVERREVLNKVIKNYTDGRIVISERLQAQNLEVLNQEYEASRRHQSAGLLFKRTEAHYNDGNNGFFLPAQPLSVKAVLLYAQRGQKGLYSQLNMAVKDQNAFVPFARVDEGLGSEEMHELSAWIKDNTVERFGPVSSVRPELVFEIHFDNISPSSRTKSGVTTTSPRIHRWIQEDETENVDTLSYLQSMFHQTR